VTENSFSAIPFESVLTAVPEKSGNVPPKLSAARFSLSIGKDVEDGSSTSNTLK
jgi:hypothetical protein